MNEKRREEFIAGAMPIPMVMISFRKLIKDICSRNKLGTDISR